MSQTQHLVFGVGLIGSYLAGALGSQGLTTSVIGRANKVAVLKRRLTLSDLYGNEVDSTGLAEFRSNKIDVLWLTVKCTAVERCIPELREIISSSTTIICCQNGFGSDQTMKTAFPQNIVLSAVFGFNVVERTPSHLHRATDGKLIVEQHSSIKDDLEQLDCPNLPIQLSTSILLERWAKLQLNLANPVNALADIPVKAMLEDAGFRRIIAGLMQEMLTVTEGLALTLPKVTTVPAKVIPRVMSLPNWFFRRVAQKMLAIDPTARTSMWWDLTQGRTTEIDYLNGSLVRAGNELGIPCPLNQRLVALVKNVESGNASIGLSACALSAILNYD